MQTAGTTITVPNLHAKGIAVNHLKRYILAHKCEHCYANIGRRHYKTEIRQFWENGVLALSQTLRALDVYYGIALFAV